MRISNLHTPLRAWKTLTREDFFKILVLIYFSFNKNLDL